jgi:hypothetical protein
MLAIASYACFAAAVPIWGLAFALQSPEGGAGERLFEAALGLLLACALFAWVGLAAAIAWRRLGPALSCAVPAAISMLVVVGFFTADWQ